MSKIDQNTMMIISRYFNDQSLLSYINIVKTCKEYLQLIELYKYNPISKENSNNVNLILNTFPQIEEYCIYIDKDKLKNIIKNIKEEINEVYKILKDKREGIYFKLIFLKQKFSLKFYINFSLTIEENINNTNINCANCKDCLFCKESANCNNCINCNMCVDCENCIKCNMSMDCKKCITCKKCTKCTKCTICEGCFDCIEASNVNYVRHIIFMRHLPTL